MRRFHVICGALLLAAATLVACGPDPAVEAEKAREAQWQSLLHAKQQLDQKREELAALRAEVDAAAAATDEAAADATADATEEAEGAAAVESPADRLAALESEVTEMTNAFNETVVTYINSDPPVRGEPLSERQAAAVRMKSDEDILIAQEFIRAGGDYRQAVKIYDAALMVDPDYERLQQLRDEAQSMRFVTEDRFAGVKKGMTPDEIREVLGQVNLRNVREYPEKNAIAWFYPRDDRGSAAAVWFQKNKRTGELTVYQADFHFRDVAEGESSEDVG
jgi:hypothetical protein